MTFNDLGALAVATCCLVTMLAVVVGPVLLLGRKKRYERW